MTLLFNMAVDALMSFEKVSMKSLSGFKQWNDAYLIALARKHRLKLCTLEGKLENMDDPLEPVLHKLSPK